MVEWRVVRKLAVFVMFPCLLFFWTLDTLLLHNLEVGDIRQLAGGV
jgi:hypothetical protein